MQKFDSHYFSSTSLFQNSGALEMAVDVVYIFKQ
jgi:hypothetical protein